MSMGNATDTPDASASTSTDTSGASAAPSKTTTLYTDTGPQTVSEFVQSITEFCATLSANDRRIEMIGAFYRVESAAGRTRALPSVFKDRYVAFLTQPA
jgi:hypothetical protein